MVFGFYTLYGIIDQAGVLVGNGGVHWPSYSIVKSYQSVVMYNLRLSKLFSVWLIIHSLSNCCID